MKDILDKLNAEQHTFTVSEVRLYTVVASNEEEAIQKCQDGEYVFDEQIWECEI